jgi:hypothetical protein
MIVDPSIWFSEREVEFVPKHFIKCNSTVSLNGREWIYNKCQGRFAFSDAKLSTSDTLNGLSGILSNAVCVYFEDQKDAMMYELLWADSK